MKRRGFLEGLVVAAAAGLLLPYEPKRIYSFPSRAYLDDNRWHTMVVTKCDDDAPLRLFVDNVEMSFEQSDSGILHTVRPLVPYKARFQGKLGEVAVFSHCMNAEEVQLIQRFQGPIEKA